MSSEYYQDVTEIEDFTQWTNVSIAKDPDTIYLGQVNSGFVDRTAALSPTSGVTGVKHRQSVLLYSESPTATHTVSPYARTSTVNGAGAVHWTSQSATTTHRATSCDGEWAFFGLLVTVGTLCVLFGAWYVCAQKFHSF